MVDYEQFKKNAAFLKQVNDLRKARDSDGNKMYDEKKIAELFKRSTLQLRSNISLAQRENRDFRRGVALYLKDMGKSAKDISEIMGKNEASVRLLISDEEIEWTSKFVKLPEILPEVPAGE